MTELENRLIASLTAQTEQLDALQPAIENLVADMNVLAQQVESLKQLQPRLTELEQQVERLLTSLGS